MNKAFLTFLGIIAVALVLGSQALFTVDQTEQAIVLQLGQPKGEPRGPGLHTKIPFIQDVRTFDRRVLSVDPQPEQMVISSAYDPRSRRVRRQQGEAGQESLEDGPSIQNVSGEPIIVDTFARYKITDPQREFAHSEYFVGRDQNRAWENHSA